LLSLIETVNLVNEQNSAPAFEVEEIFCLADDLADFGHAGGHGRKLRELHPRNVGDDFGQGRLA